jgi:hypothetical protein
MRVLTASEALVWLGPAGFVGSASLVNGFPALPPPSFERIDCWLPERSGKKVALARWIHRLVHGDDEVLIWVRNWEVWPSMGHLPLLDRLRQAMGQAKSVEKFPAHLFSTDEADDAVSVLILALEFSWDCLVVGSTFRFLCFFSHDGYYSPMSNDKSLLAQLHQSIASGNWGTLKAV